MQEWCLQHPWMTFFLTLFGLEAVSSVLQKFAVALKKPDKTIINVDGHSIEVDNFENLARAISKSEKFN